MVPIQSYAASVAGDNGDHKVTKDYKNSIYKDVNTESDSTNQHLGQDNICYKDDGCEQASEGEQTEGKDNAASGFNDQGKSLENQQNPGISATPIPVTPPVTPSTLTVTKDVTCPDGFECPQPFDFTMRVTGTTGNGNPNPATFAGSPDGTNVTLNVGDYNVTEDFEDSASSPLKVVKHFGEGCSGTIDTAGESRECNVTNEFIVKEYQFLGKFGTFGTIDNGTFNVPFGVAVNSFNDNVYVADTNNNRIQVFDGNGNFITSFGSAGSGNGQFSFPFGVAVNPSTGNVYVADTFNNRVQVFDSTGTFITILGSFNTPVAVAFNPTIGNVYVTDTGNNRIQVFDSAGNFITMFGGTGSGDGQFLGGTAGVAVNPTTGNVYVSDFINDRIQVFDGTTGTFITKWGIPGSGDGQFSNPRGVAVNPTTGNVFVADTGNNRIQVFDSAGNFITKFGSAGSGNGQFQGPTSVAVNPTTGNVYVSDAFNNRIQVFFLDP